MYIYKFIKYFHVRLSCSSDNRQSDTANDDVNLLFGDLETTDFQQPSKEDLDLFNNMLGDDSVKSGTSALVVCKRMERNKHLRLTHSALVGKKPELFQERFV